MQSNILIKRIFFFMLLAAVLSCAPKKRLASTDEGKERRVPRAERLHVLDHVTQHQLHFTTFSGRAKSKIAINKDSYDVTANVRIERDKAIWISITALMGIEVGRVLITPDSVKIINRLQSEYMNKPFDYLYRFTSNQLDFSGLQHLFIGNVVSEVIGSDTEVWAITEGYLLRGQADNLSYAMQIDRNYRMAQASLYEQERNQRLEASYAGYRGSERQVFPHQTKISIAADGLNLRSEMDYSRVVYDEALEMPFNIPSRYKEIQ